MFVLILAAAVPFAVWRGLARVGLAFPYDAVHLELYCGDREFSYMVIIAHLGHHDVGLASYV